MKKLVKFLFLAAVFAFIFSFVWFGASMSVFAEAVEETTEETTNTTNTLIEFLKGLNMNDIKAWLIAIVTKLGIDTALIFSTIIYVIRAKAKEIKTDKFYKDLVTKLDAEHQKKLEDTTAAYDAKLEALQNIIVKQIKDQNSEQRAEAKNTVDKAKAALSEIKISLDE